MFSVTQSDLDYDMSMWKLNMDHGTIKSWGLLFSRDGVVQMVNVIT